MTKFEVSDIPENVESASTQASPTSSVTCNSTCVTCNTCNLTCASIYCSPDCITPGACSVFPDEALLSSDPISSLLIDNRVVKMKEEYQALQPAVLAK